MNAIIEASKFAVTGEPKEFIVKGRSGSGKDIRLYFCPDCGSAVYSRSEQFPGAAAVKIGLLDFEGDVDPLEVASPEVEQWTCMRPSWMQDAAGAAAFEENVKM